MSYGARIAEGARRADRRAEQLLASVVGPDTFAMYRELGFLAVIPTQDQAAPGREAEEAAYGYLIYPHRPLVAFDARSGEPLSEFCVRFPDSSEPSPRLPDADDVLAKWMALQADEKLVIGESNLDPLGRQLDPGQVRRDLEALRAWADRAERTA